MNLVLPLLAVVLLGIVVTFVSSRMTTALTAWVSILMLLIGAMTILPVLIHFSLSWLVGIPSFGPVLHRVMHGNGVHLVRQPLLGVAASLFLVIAITRTATLIVSHRRLRRTHSGGIQIVSDSQMFAFALPGHDGGIVVSEGLMNGLRECEVEVVLAHEESHVMHRHDLWVLVGHICAVINPFMLRPLAMLRYALERIADEDAVSKCGDRHLVANTIAKVALDRPHQPMFLGVATLGVTARIYDIVTPRNPARFSQELVSSVGLGTVAGLCVLQWHHVFLAVAKVCAN
jgi:hypothetical protein